jgi:carboxypeptidase C (cathepsin A)
MYSRLMQHNKINHKVMAGGHMFPLEHPEAVAELVAATLKQWNES